jgi:hypothetical protein
VASRSRQDLIDVLHRTTDPNWLDPILSDPDSAAPVNATADALVEVSQQGQAACDNTTISMSSAGRGGSSTITLSRTASGTHGTIPQGYTFVDSRGLLASALGNTTVNNGDLTVQVAVQTIRKTETVNTLGDPGYSIGPNLAATDSGGTNALIGASPAPAGFPPIVSTTFTAVASSTPITDGSSDWLAAIGRERGQLRQSGESDGAFRLRVRNVPDAVSPVAVEQGAEGAATHSGLPPTILLEPFNDGADQTVRDNYQIGWFDTLYMSGLVDNNAVHQGNTPMSDFLDDMMPDAVNNKPRETVSLREASAYFRESMPGPIPAPNGGVFFLDDGFFDDPVLGFPDMQSYAKMLASLLAVWEECNRKRAAGVRFDVVIDDLKKVQGIGSTSSGSFATVFTITPPPGKVWMLRDGLFGYDSITPTNAGSVGAELVFTFLDGSTYTTPVWSTPDEARVQGPLGITSSLIVQVVGKLHTSGIPTAQLVADLVVLELPYGAGFGPAAGPRFWFDATRGVTLSGSNVTAWADQSGNALNVSDVGMPGGSRHLQYVASSVNGLPGLQGTQDFTPQSLIYTGSNVYTGGAPRTVFAVVKPGGPSMFGRLGGYIFTFRRSAPEFGLGLETVGGTDQRLYTDFTTIISASTAVDYTGTPILIRWQTDAGGTNLQTYINGASIPQTSTTLGGESGNVGFIVGSLINDDGGQVFQGDTNEIIGYDGVLSAGDITLTETYLKSKWGIP